MGWKNTGPRAVDSRREKDERNNKLEMIKETVKQKRPRVIGVSILEELIARKSKMMKLDLKLAKLLEYGGALAPRYADISRQLGIPPSTLRGRIKNLERQGIIKGYKAELDRTKFGYRYQVIQLVRFRASFDKILNRYQEWAEAYPHWINNITSIAFTSGHYAGVFIYDFAAPEEYYQFNSGFSSFMGDLLDVEELTVTSSVVTGGRPERTLEELGKMLKKIGEAADLRPEALRGLEDLI